MPDIEIMESQIEDLEERVAKLEAAAGAETIPVASIKHDPDVPAAATQPRPPRPAMCGVDISDYDLGSIHFCDNDPHYYADCCGWSCGEHKCRHARCVDDGTAPEEKDDG